MKIRDLIILTVMFIFMSSMAGCSRSVTYGERISERAFTPIKNILMNAEAYNGKIVRVKGRIETECSTGCWFDLRDGGAVIFINIEPSGLAIPQKTGALVTIEGTVEVKDKKPSLIGKGVRIE